MKTAEITFVQRNLEDVLSSLREALRQLERLEELAEGYLDLSSDYYDEQMEDIKCIAAASTGLYNLIQPIVNVQNILSDLGRE